MKQSRRDFFKQSALTGAMAAIPGGVALAKDNPPKPKRSGPKASSNSDGPTIAAIGVGGSRGAYSQGGADAMRASQFGRIIAVCDVDVVHCGEFNAKFDHRLAMYDDYRKMFEREKPDIVTIGTPDHWHVPIAVAALHAGCDVYCEKPLTLTIEEGFLIRKVVADTKKVFQVGTQQRSENDNRFLKAIAIVKSGRLGKKVNAHAAIGGAPVGGPFPTVKPIDGLDWDMWVGPAQQADYSGERRKEFRWFFDYSGGKMTDWGAHHIDIAQWALGYDHSGPVKVSGTGSFPPSVPEKFDWSAYFEGKAKLPNSYETPTAFNLNLEYANGSVLNVCNEYKSEDGKTNFPNGILFEGENGRIFVNREKLTGKPIEDMTKDEERKLGEEVLKLYGGEPGNHMKNFFDCVKSRKTPISDVETHHRTMTSCHLCNITLMLGRELKWDPKKETFEGDEQAKMLMSRPRRDKYSWKATT